MGMITLPYTRLNKKSKFLEGIINKKERTQSSVQKFPLNLESGHMTCGHPYKAYPSGTVLSDEKHR